MDTACAVARDRRVACVSDLKNRVHDLLPGLVGDLQALVRIQSVSADPERLGEVEKSARKTAQLLAAEGVGAEIVRAYDGAPPTGVPGSPPRSSTPASRPCCRRPGRPMPPRVRPAPSP